MLWNRSNDFLKLALALVFAWVLAFAPTSLRAADKADEKDAAASAHLTNFITLMRLNGFADLGIYYLEQLNAEKQLPAAFQKEYDFQLAVLTEASANLARKYEDRLVAYDNAIKLLEKYINENPEGENFYVAIGFLPNIRLNKNLVYQAMGSLNDPYKVDDSKMTDDEKKELAKRKTQFDADKKKYEELARGELKKNIDFLTNYEKIILDGAKKLDTKDKEQSAKRNDMLNELHSIRMARGNTYYELAKTYPEGSKERNENLDKARLQYKFFWDKYKEQGLLIAFRGHIKEAQMYIEMKKYAGKGEAIEILGDLYSGLKEVVSQDEILRNVFVEVCTCYLKIFTDKDSGVKPDKDQQTILLETMDQFDPSKSGSILRTYGMEGTPVGIEMRLAYIAYMERFLDLNKPKDEAKWRGILKEDVRRLYALPANPFTNEIRDLHIRYFPNEHVADQESQLTFANYKKEMKAKQAANLKLKPEKRENLYLELHKFALKEFVIYSKARIEQQTATDADRKAEIQDILANNTSKLLEVFEMLETLKSYILHEKQFEILTLDRFCRAQMLYFAGKQYEAIALLDFIAKRYSSSTQASNALYYEMGFLTQLINTECREGKKLVQAGEITQKEFSQMFRGELELLASCIEMKDQMLKEPAKYALDEVDETGQPITKQITKMPMAEEWERLCKLCLMAGAVDMAQEYIQKIPADSENRAALELSIGFNLWNMYIEYKRADENAKPFSEKQATEYQKLALDLLESGAQKLKKSVKKPEDVTSTVVAAAMTLCDSYSRRGDNKNAVKWLNDETIGPYKLLCDEHPAVTDDKKDKILNIALVAFVSENDMEKANDAMDRLEKLAASEGADTDMDEKLTRKYMSLGIQLRSNLQSMKASGDEEALAKVKDVQKGFEDFLKRIQERENGNSYASLNWIAQTFISLAEGSLEGKEVGEESKKYFESAIGTYETMLERMKSDPSNFVPNADEEKIGKLAIGLQRKIAETSEELGDFEKADKYYRLVLTAKPGVRELQYKMLNMYVNWSLSITDPEMATKKTNLLVMTLTGIRSDDKKTMICRGWTAVQRDNNRYTVLDDSNNDPTYLQNRWLYYYAVLQDNRAKYLFGRAKGNSDPKGKENLNAAMAGIRRAFDAGNGTSTDFGGSIQMLDAEGNPTGEYLVKDGLVYEPLADKYEELLKNIQKALGEEPTGFANWTREVVQEEPEDPDAFTTAEIDDNADLEQLEEQRLSREEDTARKMMTPKAKPTPQWLTYTYYGIGGFVVLIFLLVMLRGGGNSKSAKRRKAMLAQTSVPKDGAAFQAAASEESGPVSLGIGDEVVDSKAGANAFAAMGFGDAPVIEEETKKEETPVFDFGGFGDAPAASAAPAAEKPAVKKVVKKPAPAAPAAAAAETAEKQPVKKVVKKVVKKPAPTADAPAEKPAEKPEEKPTEAAPAKKVIKLVKKPENK